MNGTEQSHIPADQLEEAARGRLPAEQLAAVDAHCAVCAQCRNAYQEERRIAQGARSFARAALKQRLATAVAHERTGGTPWPRILATAAVILVLAGTGLVYHWLTRGTEAPVAITAVTSTDSTAVLAERAIPLEKSGQAPPPVHAAAPAQKDEAPQEQGFAVNEMQRPKLSAEMEAVEPPMPAPATHPAQRRDALQSMVSDTRELVLWGAPLADASEKKDKALKAADAAQGGAARSEARNRAQGAVGYADLVQSARVFVVSQQHILAMVKRDASTPPDAVPARITRDGDTIRVVLLLDHLLQPERLSAASVQEFPPDSFQVVLSGLRLGFKTPAGYLK